MFTALSEHMPLQFLISSFHIVTVVSSRYVQKSETR